MGYMLGKKLKISVFGQSHSKAVGVSIDGFPHGFTVDMDRLQGFLARRAPGQSRYTTRRTEKDIPEFISGIVDNTTCGAPICAIIQNTDTRPEDYANILGLPRPGHADYSAYIKYQGSNDVRGGGHFSARLTAPICVAGGLCLQLLSRLNIDIGAHIASIADQGSNDVRGGGHFSARLTAPICVAGGLCLQLLSRLNIDIGAHIASIADVEDTALDPVTAPLESILKSPLPVIDSTAGERMLERIEAARLASDSVGGVIECAVRGVPAGLGEPIFESVESSSTAGERMLERIEAARLASDSVGGVIECAVRGVPAGLGEPIFESVESRLSGAIFSIPAVRGIEFGAGFGSAQLRGSKHNDSFAIKADKIVTETNNHAGILGGITTGMPIVFRVAFKPTPSIATPQQSVDLKTHNKIVTETNNHAGILGGITTGMPIVFRVAFKPTPSIATPQQSVDLKTHTQQTLIVKGRHDPCVVPRAVPIVEAIAAIVVVDMLLERYGELLNLS